MIVIVVRLIPQQARGGICGLAADKGLVLEHGVEHDPLGQPQASGDGFDHAFGCLRNPDALARPGPGERRVGTIGGGE